MKILPLSVCVFLLVFLGGLGWLLLFRKGSPQHSAAFPVHQRLQPAAGVSVSAVHPSVREKMEGKKKDFTLPPLPLPRGAERRAGAENSWEYMGEIAANFVSARAQFISCFRNASWIPEKRITLDASRMPRMILTFSQKDYDLTLLLWKIGPDRTGFSCRRDKKTDYTGEMIP